MSLLNGGYIGSYGIRHANEMHMYQNEEGDDEIFGKFSLHYSNNNPCVKSLEMFFLDPLYPTENEIALFIVETGLPWYDGDRYVIPASSNDLDDIETNKFFDELDLVFDVTEEPPKCL